MPPKPSAIIKPCRENQSDCFTADRKLSLMRSCHLGATPENAPAHRYRFSTIQVWLRSRGDRKMAACGFLKTVVLAMISRSCRQRLVAIHKAWRAPLFLLLARTLTSSVANPTSRNRRVNARSGAEDQTANTPFGRSADLAALRPSWLYRPSLEARVSPSGPLSTSSRIASYAAVFDQMRAPTSPR